MNTLLKRYSTWLAALLVATSLMPGAAMAQSDQEKLVAAAEKTFDNFVRPFLIKRGADLPLLLIFAGVIGGLLGFGLVGIFVGPVMLAVSYTLINAWLDDRPDAPEPQLTPIIQPRRVPETPARTSDGGAQLPGGPP